jgi:hypothetical protein
MLQKMIKSSRLFTGKNSLRCNCPRIYFSSEIRDGVRSHNHFRTTQTPHPLITKNAQIYETNDYVAGDHTGRQQNHIWSKEELKEKMSTLYRHKPQSISDYITNSVVST